MYMCVSVQDAFPHCDPSAAHSHARKTFFQQMYTIRSTPSASNSSTNSLTTTTPSSSVVRWASSEFQPQLPGSGLPQPCRCHTHTDSSAHPFIRHIHSLDYLIERIWDDLGLVRVYTKKRGAHPDLDDPVCMRKGSTIEVRLNHLTSPHLSEDSAFKPSTGEEWRLKRIFVGVGWWVIGRV